ncbi:MAG: FAD-dependent thymidylate synthase [Deinococcaceae bacterium]
MIALRESVCPLGDEIGSVELIQYVGDDAGIAKAARVSFANDRNTTEPERDFKLIKYLLQHGHGSPFEHNLLTFRVTCPIFVDRQWVRHRIGVSKNEESGRYIELQERCYIPQNFRRQAEKNRQASVEDTGTLDQESATTLYKQAWRHAFETYTQLLAMGVAREQARGILPLSLYTSSYYTFNVRSLLHFLELRDHEGAQYEMQLYAKSLCRLAEPLFPLTFQAWRELKDAQDPPT